MIHRIYSNLPTFKSIVFHKGLNILLAQKETGATDKQTRNRAGKTSLVEIIHFLTGADAGPDSLFRTDALKDFIFGISLDIEGNEVSVERSGKEKSKVHIRGTKSITTTPTISNSEWIDWLGERMFDIQDQQDYDGRVPSFRSLFSYFVRRQLNGAFTTPEKQATQQQLGDYQVALLYLMGLDWHVASEWQKVRDREKTLSELKKAAGAGAFGSIIGKASDLRTQLTVNEAHLKQLSTAVSSFHVHPQYSELESEADMLTKQINALSNANVIDEGLIGDLESVLQLETPPPLNELKRMYEEVGVYLPEIAVKRYEEVQTFHESVIRNRSDYLQSEIVSAKERISKREKEKRNLDDRRATVMKLLNSHGALEQFANLQAEATRKEAEVESLRHRFSAAEQLEGTKNELDIERNHLTMLLRRDFMEQSDRLSEAILAFEETSKRLYESAGRMVIEETSNGPQFKFPMQGSSSKGIKNMQIFCFDMMLMRLCSKRKIGPGFLVHDSHLFDGVDGRQVASALKVGAETAEELGFQYLVTMNEDDALKETTSNFNIRDYFLPIVLTDAVEDGGLFGIRF